MALIKYKLGDLICQRREKYSGTDNLPVRGVSREGFIPAKKSGKGTNQIFYKNDFVFNPARMELNSIAFNRDYEKALCSSTYEIFFVVKPEIILPDYLNLFVKRSEFARWCDFVSTGSVRECCHVEDISTLEITLPPLDVQEKFVAVYNSLVENKKVYERGLNDLKLVCDGYIDGLKHTAKKFRLGEILEEIDERNFDGKYNKAYGINITKNFMLSNSSSDDLRRYKIVRKNQFVCSLMRVGRDKVIPVALLDKNCPLIVSPAYIVLEIKSDSVIPEYLFMWLSRSETDRRAVFMSDASIRSGVEKQRFFEMEIPIPSLEIQKSIAAIYDVYRTRQKILERLKLQIKKICPILIKGSLDEGAKI